MPVCRLSYTEELQATVLEVKAIGGFGTTIDVVLVGGGGGTAMILKEPNRYLSQVLLSVSDPH